MLLLALVASLPWIQNVGDLAEWLPTREERVEAMTQEALQEWNDGLSRLLAIPEEERTYENTIRGYDEINGQMAAAIQAIHTIQSIHPDKALRDKLLQAQQKLTKTHLESCASHPELFTIFKSIRGNFSEGEQYYLNHLLKSCQAACLDASEQERQQAARVDGEIKDLCSTFYRHLAEDQSCLRLSREQLTGLDEAWLASREESPGLYRLASDFPTMTLVLSSCSVKETRQAMFELFYNRAWVQNEEVVKQLVAKRNELAQLAGYPHFSALSLSFQMAQTPAKVREFIRQIQEKAIAKAQAEFEAVCSELPEGVTPSAPHQLERFDESYAFTAYKNRHYSIDPSKIAEYFPLEQTLERLLDVYQQFFGLTFKEVPHGIPVPDLKALEVRDQDDQFMGVILLDLFPRAGKASHVGMCCELIPRWAPLDATVYPGSALIVGNFTKPTSERPSLMTHSEATTFFHEFGHAIHHLLGQSSFMSFCGCNVKTDFVEVPSILLEEWMWDAEILKKVSNHYVTGEPLSDEMIQNMIAARQFGMGGNMERLCFLSLLSLALFEDNGEIQPTAFAQEIWKRESPHVACREQYHILTSWWHVPEYGPKYYAYLWSRALAADLFEKIKQGGLLNPEMGRAYVETILSKGGSRDPYQLLSDFLGRKPTLDAFFKQL